VFAPKGISSSSPLQATGLSNGVKGGLKMAYKGLRDWINTLEKEGELARVKTKVDWNLEIGGINQKAYDMEGPALLFENIKDHENTLCRKLFTSSLSTFPRIALMMGLPKDSHPRKLIKTYMERTKKLVKPKIIKDGPVKENILKGDDVNLFELPAPKWHQRDGGRYLITMNGVVTKDPETKWQNVGTYRGMVHDRNHTGMSIVHNQHIWMHWRKHKKLGRKTMPCAVVLGCDPVLPMVASSNVPTDVDEYDVMGAIREEPVELVKCETVDLEVPSSAEIILEGEISLDVSTFRPEGPFGEYSGYYASGERGLRPVFTVNCIT
jgi:4-hydroxy-3-polyprenylbenzoate decarboxylase